MHQQRLNTHIIQKIQADPNITHALAYGSFTHGMADQHSDLEYFVYLHPHASLDGQSWLNAIEPVVLWVTNEFGTPNALMASGVRIEFHIEPSTAIHDVLHWPNHHASPERMLIKDQEGELLRVLTQLASKLPVQPDAAQALHDRVLNMLAFTAQLIARGERYRAWEVHAIGMGTVLRLTRLVAQATQHWLNASRRLEWELPEIHQAGLVSCTGSVDQMEQLHQTTLDWTLQLAQKAGLDPRLEARRIIQSLLLRPGVQGS